VIAVDTFTLIGKLIVLCLPPVLVNIVLEDSSDGLLECTRVYGNLSRYPTVRKILAEKKGREY